MAQAKTTLLRDAIAEHVHDGDTVALEGFTHLIPFAAGHELIRQRRRDLHLVRMTPDILFDQLIAAGVARHVTFSFAGSSVGSLHAFRRALESGAVSYDEYSHYGLLARYQAGAAGLPFFPIKSYAGSDLVDNNPSIRAMRSPFPESMGEDVYVVPPIHPDVAIVHAQRADRHGNIQAWGITGPMQEVTFASKRTIVLVEEIVEDELIRADPNRTVIPSFVVDAVVQVPYGAHPSFVQGRYDRDNGFYRNWPAISKDPARLQAWLDEWILGTTDHTEYLAKLGADYFAPLTPVPALSGAVDYGCVA